MYPGQNPVSLKAEEGLSLHRLVSLEYQQVAFYELYLLKVQLSWDSGLWRHYTGLQSVWSRKVPTQV